MTEKQGLETRVELLKTLDNLEEGSLTIIVRLLVEAIVAFPYDLNKIDTERALSAVLKRIDERKEIEVIHLP
jgi:hypothetical protein